MCVCLPKRSRREQTQKQTGRQADERTRNSPDKNHFSSAATLKTTRYVSVTAPALRPQNSRSSQITVTTSRVCQHHVTSLSAKSVCQITLNDGERDVKSLSASASRHKCVSVTSHHKYVSINVSVNITSGDYQRHVTSLSASRHVFVNVTSCVGQRQIMRVSVTHHISVNVMSRGNQS